jgi:heme/copper-type cytochrome/quinol oxidase subunit 2
MKSSRAGLHNLLCCAANFGKIWSACGQHTIQRTDEEWISISVITCITLPVYFSIYHVHKKYTVNNGKNKKNVVHNIECHYFWHFFTKWIRYVIHVSKNKHLKSFRNIIHIFVRLYIKQNKKCKLIRTWIFYPNFNKRKHPRYKKHKNGKLTERQWIINCAIFFVLLKMHYEYV